MAVSPYYDHGGVTIYHADCRDLIGELSYDLLVTDPPYGIGYQSTMRPNGASNRFPRIHGDDVYPSWIFDHLAPVASHVFVRWDRLADCPVPTSCLVWDKGYGGMADPSHCYAPQWEAVLFYRGDRHEWRGGRPADVLRHDKVPSGALRHPTEKPVPLMQALISHHEGSVLDPFMGSGTTLVAAKHLGRKAIGIEIEERYCEVAAERLSQEVLAL